MISRILTLTNALHRSVGLFLPLREEASQLVGHLGCDCRIDRDVQALLKGRAQLPGWMGDVVLNIRAARFAKDARPNASYMTH